MSSLLSLYKAKEKNGTEMSAKKTFLVPLSELYIEPGYNVREIDQAHIEEFRDAYIAGEFVPPLAVQVTDKGIKIIDGHHRYHGALLATQSGTEIPRLECKDFSGTEAERIAFMVTSSQGKPLTSLERAAAYQRLANQGWEPAEIAKRVKRSQSDVDHHLQLLTCGDELIEMVKSGAVAATTAVALSREHGTKAGSVALEQMAKVKAAGKTKLSRSAAMPQFSSAKMRKLIELIAKNCEAELAEETFAISLDFETGLQALEAIAIINEAKSHYGIREDS
jgi:ParB/RepB/Spo0J family partition protein